MFQVAKIIDLNGGRPMGQDMETGIGRPTVQIHKNINPVVADHLRGNKRTADDSKLDEFVARPCDTLAIGAAVVIAE